MKQGDKRPIIVIRKKGHAHAGHHGGAWKVAYADFVTAMMAFFMVMWLLSMDEHVRDSIQGYFSNPVGYKKGYSSGKSPISVGSSPNAVQTTPIRLVSRITEEQTMGKVGDRIEQKLNQVGFSAIAKNVQIIRTDEGLRIELVEGPSGDLFFPLASATMKPALKQALELIEGELAPLHNPIYIEGHTDAAQYSGLYSNWELSSDRANAARRVLETAGLDPGRVVRVTALADRELRFPENPLDPRNRRISLVLPFTTPPDSAAAAAPRAPPGQ